MTESNAELLAQAFAGFRTGDPTALGALLHPDCELVVPDSIPYAASFRGAEQVRDRFTRQL
ncbi:nuclear transport factor 2 family protein [Nocardia thraciensis]